MKNKHLNMKNNIIKWEIWMCGWIEWWKAEKECPDFKKKKKTHWDAVILLMVLASPINSLSSCISEIPRKKKNKIKNSST